MTDWIKRRKKREPPLLLSAGTSKGWEIQREELLEVEHRRKLWVKAPALINTESNRRQQAPPFRGHNEFRYAWRQDFTLLFSQMRLFFAVVLLWVWQCRCLRYPHTPTLCVCVFGVFLFDNSDKLISPLTGSSSGFLHFPPDVLSFAPSSL